jgi:hypothetical protein
MLCERVEPNPAGLILAKPVSVLRVTGFPWTQSSLGAVFILKATPGTYAYDLKIVHLDSLDVGPVHRASLDVPEPHADNVVALEYAQLVFTKPGAYSVQLSVDDQPAGELPFEVVKL